MCSFSQESPCLCLGIFVSLSSRAKFLEVLLSWRIVDKYCCPLVSLVLRCSQGPSLPKDCCSFVFACHDSLLFCHWLEVGVWFSFQTCYLEWRAAATLLLAPSLCLCLCSPLYCSFLCQFCMAPFSGSSPPAPLLLSFQGGPGCLSLAYLSWGLSFALCCFVFCWGFFPLGTYASLG